MISMYLNFTSHLYLGSGESSMSNVVKNEAKDSQ